MKTIAHAIRLNLVFVTFLIPAFAMAMGPLAKAQREGRLEHAQELLGSTYSKSVVRTGEQIKKVNGAVYNLTKLALSKKHRAKSPKIAQAIIDEAQKYEFDPIFVLAVIQTESSFNPEQIGGVGEIGLMQIRPETAAWIAKKAGIKWPGAKALRDPVMNIKIGCAYMSWLREKFDSHARLYIAAYNMGQGNVRGLLQKDVWPKDYPSRVMQNYVSYYETMKEARSSRKVSSI